MEQKPFFRPGGTLDPNAQSYIVRGADEALIQALLAGEYVFLLDSRQKGKSSLVARTIVRLKEHGVVSVKLDLQRIGANLTPEQWYAGLLSEIGQDLGITKELFEYWSQNQSVGPLARWVGALGAVVLVLCKQPIVIFVDEVDYVKSLPFPTDEFFAGIRDCYNRRSDNPVFQQLTFCLVGVATPGQLIRNPEITPFNIGTRIDLSDFDLEDLSGYTEVLANGSRDGPMLLRRVHRWTNGHPYLTQLVCSQIVGDQTVRTESGVDRLIHKLFLTPEARQRESNLADVERRILDPDLPGLSHEERRSQILDVYHRLLQGKRVESDDENPLMVTLTLSGVSVERDGVLQIRNRIYATVFNEAWRRSALPDAETRRQRAAAGRAVLRTTFIAGVIVAVMGLFIVWNIGLAEQVRAERDKAQYESYCSSMISTSQLWEDNYWQGIADIVKEQEHNPAKGWEWNYWSYLSRNHALVDDGHGFDYDYRWSRDGKSIISRRKDGIAWIDPTTGRILDKLGSPSSVMTAAFELPKSRILDVSWNGDITIWDADRKVVVWRDEIPPIYWRPNGILDPTGRYLLGGKPGRIWRYDLEFGKLQLQHGDGNDDKATYGARGRMISVVRNTLAAPPVHSVGLLDPVTLRLTREFPMESRTTSSLVDPTGTFLVAGLYNGDISFIDLATGTEFHRESTGGSAAWRMEFSSDGRYLSVGTTGAFARIFEVNGKTIRLFGDVRGVTDAYWNNQVDKILAIYFQARVIPFNEIASPPLNTDPKSLLRIDPDQGTVTSVVNDRVTRYDLKVMNPTPVTKDIKGRFRIDTRFDNVSPMVPMKTPAGTDIYRLSTLERFDSLPASVGEVFGYSELKGQKKALLIVDGTNVRLYDTATKQVSQIEAKTASGVFTSPEGRFAVFAGDNFTVSIWDTRRDTWIHSEEFGPGELHDCVFTHDEKRFVGAFDSGYLQLVDSATGKMVRTFRQHSGNARCVAFSPDESRIASGGDDKAIRVWDTKTGRLLTVLRGHKADPIQVAFIEGGKTLVSYDLDGRVFRWRTEPYRSAK